MAGSNSGCCKLVGNFDLFRNESGCFTSISMNSQTEVTRIVSDSRDVIITGPTVGNISITAYAYRSLGGRGGGGLPVAPVHVGCPARANLTLNWLRKYDCENDEVHFIYNGAGKASISGPVDTYGISFFKNLDRSFRMLNASSNSGPATIYTDDTQYEGYGLKYTGGPLSINVTDETPVVDTSIFEGLDGVGEVYLQSFSFEASPGNVPTASYSFIFVITGT